MCIKSYKTSCFIIFLLHLIIVIAQQDTFQELDPDCPCIGIHAHNNTPKTNDGNCLEARIVTNSSMMFSTHCYPIDYGIGCRAHDKNNAPFCNGEVPPEFCDQPFCYVDPHECKHSGNSSFVQSKFFPHLFYSFSTCGASGKFEEHMVIDSLRGQTLRVGVPAIYFPDHYKLDENGELIFFDKNTSKGVGEWRGIYIDHIKDISSLGGFNIEWHSVSPGAIELRDGDAWAACVVDVHRGLLDLCVGNVWETLGRKKIASFTTSIYNDFFKVVVSIPKIERSIVKEMGKLFQPFTIGLWITIIGVTVLVGITYTLLSSPRRTLLSYIRENLFSSIYDAALELLSGTDSPDRSLALKFVSLTWAFFILITIAAYTANLAAFLSQAEITFKVTDIHDCVNKGCNLCSLRSPAVEKTLSSKFPSLILDANYDNAKELNADLLSGKCDALVVSELYWSFNAGLDKDCATTFVGEFSFFFQVAWPVADQYAKALSYWLGTLEERGEFHELDIVQKYIPVNSCPEPMNEQQRDKLAMQITARSMLGNLIILVAGIVGAFALKFAKCIKRRKERKTRMIRLRQTGRRRVRFMRAESDPTETETAKDIHEQ